MRTFKGFRPAPPEDYVNKGITNGGWTPDYEGVIFDDGTVVIRWLTAFQSHSIWRDYDTFYRVHGHPEYGTRIVFDDEENIGNIWQAILAFNFSDYGLDMVDEVKEEQWASDLAHEIAEAL